MNGCTQEQTLRRTGKLPGKFIVANLKDYRAGFNNEDSANQEQQYFLFDQDRNEANSPADTDGQGVNRGSESDTRRAGKGAR